VTNLLTFDEAQEAAFREYLKKEKENPCKKGAAPGYDQSGINLCIRQLKHIQKRLGKPITEQTTKEQVRDVLENAGKGANGHCFKKLNPDSEWFNNYMRSFRYLKEFWEKS
jgi:hypothetical protein